MSELEEKIITAYREGSEMNYMVECFNISENQIKNILTNYKESNRLKRTFTDDFKKIIAERDINGIPRRQISIELEINASTVRKACEKFGQALKDKATSDNSYTKIWEDNDDIKLDLSKCPSCDNRNINQVDDNAIYCKSCGNEFFKKNGVTYMINWCYID